VRRAQRGELETQRLDGHTGVHRITKEPSTPTLSPPIPPHPCPFPFLPPPLCSSLPVKIPPGTQLFMAPPRIISGARIAPTRATADATECPVLRTAVG
jgi:hypothetical protein